MRYVAV